MGAAFHLGFETHLHAERPGEAGETREMQHSEHRRLGAWSEI